MQLFKKVFVLQKCHGTSAHIHFDSNGLCLFSGGAKHDQFEKLFNKEELLSIYKEFYDGKTLTLYGECAGASMQGMKHTYGNELFFIAFDCMLDSRWQNVPSCEFIAKRFNQKFVFYKLVDNTIEELDKYRDWPSQIAAEKGLGERPEEGVVIRPLQEMFDVQGGRFIKKHKRDPFNENRSPREVDPNKAVQVFRGQQVAEEFVTANRLQHVMDQLVVDGFSLCLQHIPILIQYMKKDLEEECSNEIENSIHVQKAVAGKTVSLFKEFLNNQTLQTASQEIK